MPKYNCFNLIKRQARAMSEDEAIPLSVAQERIARQAKFVNFHELRKVANKHPSDDRLFFQAFAVRNFEDVIYDKLWDEFESRVDDEMSSDTATTNAYSYTIENLYFESIEYDEEVGILTVETTFDYQGDQDEDRVWSGNEFSIDCRMRIVRREGWAFAGDDGALLITVTDTDVDRDYREQRAE